MQSKILTRAASLFLAGFVGVAALAAQGPPSGPPPPPDVSVITVQPRLVPVTFSYSGVTAASKTVEIRARVQGYLESREFEEGALVKEGTRLFTIDPRTFEADTEIAGARVEQAEARRKLADQEVKRMKSVTLPGAVAATDIDSADAELAEATASLRLAKAELAKAELELSYTKIDAPLTGLIGKAQKEIGSLVDIGENSLLAVMHQVEPIYVSLRVAERDFLAWRNESESGALVKIDGHEPYMEITLNDLSTYEKRGTINYLSPDLSMETGSYEVRAAFENPDVKLRPGQFIKGHIKGWARPNSITVPQRAVNQSPQGSFVYIVGDDNIAQPRPVELGHWTGADWIVLSGLSGGERVIVEGLTKVRPGSEVKPGPSPDQPTEPRSNQAAP
ncbi:MAG: efflux RND transporter periplasmic adaptor subunit [Candidatus Hydrogenedentes bacterium]|nr:efflux RND transporter periplasmic adaptor subunit [Candidatus Hydrogenedentota bacterium]